MPQIRIDDETYIKLKDAADLGKRTVGQHISFLLENEVTFQEIKALIKKEGQNPEKNLSSQANNDDEIQQLLVERGRVLNDLEENNLVAWVQKRAVDECWSDEQAKFEGDVHRKKLEYKRDLITERLKSLNML